MTPLRNLASPLACAAALSWALTAWAAPGASTSPAGTPPGPDDLRIWAEFNTDAPRTQSGASVRSIAASERPGDVSAESMTVSQGLLQVGGRVSETNGSRWHTLGMDVGAVSGAPGVDLSTYRSLRIRLASATPRVLRLRLKGPDIRVQNAGCYPVVMQKVGPVPTDFSIPLVAFEPEPWCGAKGVMVDETLPAVTLVEVTANDPSAEPVRFSVGRIAFARSVADTAAPRPVAAPEPRAAAWKLLWSDEFDGAAGKPAAEGRWQLARGTQGLAAGERQAWGQTVREAAHDGQGHFSLRAHEAGENPPACADGPCSHVSAQLQLRPTAALLYGRVEVRLRAPAVPGLLTRVALAGAPLSTLPWPEAGEISLMEFAGGEPQSFDLGLYGPGLDEARTRGHGVVDAASAGDDGFHVIALEWSPEQWRWWLDDVPQKTLLRQDLPEPARPAFNSWPYLLQIGLAVNGAPASTAQDAALLVDHVRIYQRDDLAAQSRPRLAEWQRLRSSAPPPAVAAAEPPREAAREATRPRRNAPAPSTQPVRQVTCERNRLGLMMCY